MTSAINPSIDVNYPVPGVNNSSQGFRSNFASINTSLQTAATEISDLQSKVLLKSALTGQTLDNDMNNGVIKNAQTLNFRASTYELGSNLTGTVNIDLTLGDVQFGVTGGNVNLSFSGWATAAPSGKWGGVDVILTGVAGRTIGLPAEVRLGVDTIEGYDANTNSITVPSTGSRVHYRFNSISCGVIVSGNAGSGIEIVPMDRPRQATQVVSGAPITSDIVSTGTITAATNSSTVTGSGTLFTTELVVGRQIKNSSGQLIGTVSAIASNTSLTLSSNAIVAVTGGTYKRVVPTGSSGDVLGDIKTDGTYVYVCADIYDGTSAIWKRTLLSTY